MDGIEVTFRAGGKEYRRGDYWLIHARTAGNRIDWPQEAPRPSRSPGQTPSPSPKPKLLAARRADGGAAPLAVIAAAADGAISVEHDLRGEFEPAARPIATSS